MPNRTPVPVAVQLKVLFRDQWLCYVCRRPLIFPLAMKQLAELTARDAPPQTPAYYNLQWRRDLAPLLDELAACIDHVDAFAKGGGHGIDNFAAICARCNARKSDRTYAEYVAALKPWKVRGKHGEPKAWDGLTSVFVALASRSAQPLTASERAWLRALRDYFAREAAHLGAPDDAHGGSGL